MEDLVKKSIMLMESLITTVFFIWLGVCPNLDIGITNLRTSNSLAQNEICYKVYNRSYNLLVFVFRF